ncbi:MAG: BatD family protein [Polyangiaceae bacterium]|jgi:hypothetical protein
MRRFALFLALVALFFAPPSARAQSAPQMSVQSDADTVGVGDIVHLEFTAQSGDGMPTDPQPGATPGFVVRGQSSSPSQTHISINGNRIDRFGLTVDWALQAQRVGTFTVGPPTVLVGGTRFSARTVNIHVVPAGQGPQRPSQQQSQPPFQNPAPFAPFQQGPGFSPFDPWRGLFPGIDQGAQPSVTTDPRLALDAPAGAFYFLHAAIDNPTAVVGQQVTYSVYEYLDEGAGQSIEVDPADVRDPGAAEFVKHPLLRDDQEAILVGYAQVGGRIWKVNLVRRWALFPLHAGDLVIGPMSVTLVRPRSAAGSKRATDALRIHVTEPPAAGRPPGYALGDVGRFALAAQVNPRDLEQGGAVGVHVELSGTGNVPAAIAPPVRTGVEWLAPELHEQLGSIGREATTFGGKRTFDYVVRVHRAGDVDLGEMALPFWDPEQKHYAVARATLGVVHVKPSAVAPAASGDAPDQEMLPGLPSPRDALEGTAPAHAHLDDNRFFWLLGVGSWPVAFGFAVAGTAAGRRLARRWRAKKASPATDLKDRMSAANAACRGKDARAVDAAVAHALEAAAIAHAGVNVRGAVGDEVIVRLEGAGVARDAASRVAELLRECEAARFAPDAADVLAARDRWQRAQGAIRQMERR